MMEGWKKVTLEEVSTKIGDGLHGTPKYDEMGEYYFVNGNNLENGKIVIKTETKKISFEQYNKIKKELNDRTILVAINGTIGNLGFYSGEPIALGKSACYINLKNEVNKYFIRYVLEFEHFQNYAYLFATGSTIKNLGLKAVRKYPFLLPPLPTQHKIASILSAYDDLIENNLKRINLLEEKAQLTHEEWFVRMKFPRHETTTISKETGLPEGWKKMKIKNYVKVISKGPSLKYDQPGPKFPVLNQSCVRNGEIELEKVLYASELSSTKQECYLELNDILINSMGQGTLGRVSKNVSVQERFIIHNCITFLRAKDIYSQFMLFYFISMHKPYFESIAQGSTGQSTLKKELVSNLEIKVPENNLLNEFDSIIKPIWKSIGFLKNQNQLLKEARDVLLPRLMTGIIDVEKMNLENLQPTSA